MYFLVFIWYQNLLGRENFMVVKSIFTEFVSKFLFVWVETDHHELQIM